MSSTHSSTEKVPAEPVKPARNLNRSISLDFSRPGIVLLIAWVIFVGALGLRISGLGEYPARHATDDEFHNMWVGLNFYDSGMPSSWSGLAGARHIGVAHFDKTGYHMVAPAFDHPPLFSLVAGAVAKLTHPKRIVERSEEGHLLVVWDVDLSRARWMTIPLFVAAFWLLFFITRTGFGPPLALLTVFMYGFMSHAITHGRLIISDNMSVVWLLSAIWAAQAWHTGRLSPGRMHLVIILSTAAAVITKVPAWCQIPALMAYFIAIRRPLQMWSLLAGFAVGLGLYLVWILHFGLAGFVTVMASQASRFRGFNAFQLFSGVPRLLDIIDMNGVLVAAWFCVLVQVMRPRSSALMLILPVYMLAFTFFAGDVLYGWYSIPMFPLLILALAVTTAQVYRRPHMGMALGWMLLLLPHCFQTLDIARHDLVNRLRFSYVAIVALLLFCYALPWRHTVRIIRITMIAVIALVFLREVYEVTNRRTDRLTDKEKYF